MSATHCRCGRWRTCSTNGALKSATKWYGSGGTGSVRSLLQRFGNIVFIDGHIRCGGGIWLWQQTEGKVDAFVQGVGTGGSLRGIAESLIGHNSDVHIIAVEPSESAVLSGEKSGSHKIEGIGAGFVVPLWKPEIVGEIAKVSTEESMAMARRLAKEEGVFGGTSTGGNLIVALKKAKELGPRSTVVTLMVDSGIKYLSTALYKDVK